MSTKKAKVKRLKEKLSLTQNELNIAKKRITYLKEERRMPSKDGFDALDFHSKKLNKLIDTLCQNIEASEFIDIQNGLLNHYLTNPNDPLTKDHISNTLYTTGEISLFLVTIQSTWKTIQCLKERCK